MKLRAYADEWLQRRTRGLAPDSLKRYRNALDALCAYLGPRELAEVTLRALRNWRAARLTERAEATAALDVGVVRTLFRQAHQEGLVPEDPAEALELVQVPRRPTPLSDELTYDAVKRAIEDYVEEPYRSALLVLLSTGLRVGELLGLGWADLQEGGGLFVRPHGEALKTPGSVARLPSSPTAQTALGKLKGHALNGQVAEFRDEEGRPLSKKAAADRLRSRLKRALKKAGLRPVSTHKLRHIFATHLWRLGTPAPIVKELMRHRSIETTMLYTHITREDLGKAVEAL